MNAVRNYRPHSARIAMHENVIKSDRAFNKLFPARSVSLAKIRDIGARRSGPDKFLGESATPWPIKMLIEKIQSTGADCTFVQSIRSISLRAGVTL